MSKLIPFALIFFFVFSCLAETDIQSDSINPSNSIDNKAFLNEAGFLSSKSLGDFAIGCLEMLDNEALNSSSREHLLESIKKNPEARLPIAMLMGEWFKKGRYQDCVDNFLPLAKEHPEAIDLNLATASAMICLKKNQEAVALLEPCFNSIEFPVEGKDRLQSAINLISCLGDLYGKLKMFDEGEDLFDKVLKDKYMSEEYKVRTSAAIFFSLRADQGEDGFFSGWVKRRFRKKMADNLDAFETIWNRLLQSSSLNKTKFPAVLELSPVLEINKRYKLFEASERLILNTLISFPENEYALRLIAALYGDWGQYGCSYRTWKKISQKSNSDPFCYYELGHSALMIRNFPEAAKSFEWLLLLNPDFNSIAVYQLGISYYEMGKYDKAILKLDKVSDLPEAKYIAAMCHRNENHYKLAVSAMEEAERIALSKKRDDFLSHEFYLTYAAFCDKAEMFEKTVDILEKQVTKFPDDPETVNFLGYVLAVNNKRLDYSEKLIRIAISKDEGNPAYLDSMAWLYFRKKDYISAKTFMTKALGLEGNSPDAVIADHAGDIFYALGEKDNALRYWKLSAGTYSSELNLESVREKIKSAESTTQAH